jgi:hypothetical protein
MSTRVQHIRGTTTEIEGVTPLPAELGFDTTKKEPHIGDGATAGGIRLAKKHIREILVPAQISANTNDYNPAGMKHASVLVMSTDAARDLTGIVPSTVTDATDGRELTVYNGGSFNLTLKDQSASSSVANRFDLGGADIVMTPKASATLRYRTSGSLNRWEMVAQTAGAAVAAQAVIARTLAASSQGFSMINGTIVESHTGGAVTFAIKTLTGNDPSTGDPVLVLVRNGTLATGDYTVMTLTSATSITVSSGSSLGTTNSAAFKVWLVGFNDAGTFRLGIINPLDGLLAQLLLTPDQPASSTAEGGAGNADSALTFYTGAAVTSKPYAVLGFADYPAGLASAGAWSVSPTTLQLYHAAVPLPGRGVAAQIRNLASPLINGTIVPSVSSNVLQIAIKTLAGNDPSPSDPVYVIVRNATAGSGDFTVMPLTAATSLFIGVGSTLGALNGTPFRIWLVAFNDAGTLRLSVINCLSGNSIYPLGQFPIASGTVTGNIAQVFYTTVPPTSKPYQVLGYMSWETGLATAGTWSAGPTRTQLFEPGSPLPGQDIQLQRSDTGAMATGTTITPFDDTIPQNTEGDQYMSLAITPTSAANLLKVTASAFVAHSVGSGATLALFRDSAASAVTANCGQFFAANVIQQRNLDYTALAASIAQTTFKLRVGPAAAATITFNGQSSARLMGGAMNSFMEARELMA